MALVKEAVLKLRAEGFAQAQTAGQGIADSTEQAARSTERLSQSARTAGVSLTRALSRVGTAAALIGGTLGGLSENPLLRGVFQTFRGASIGAVFGGVPGAIAGGALSAISAAAGAAGESRTTNLNITNNVPLQDGDVRRALHEANESLRHALERRLQDLDEVARARSDFDFGGLGR